MAASMTCCHFKYQIHDPFSVNGDTWSLTFVVRMLSLTFSHNLWLEDSRRDSSYYDFRQSNIRF
jgi:hypothetical protein